MVSGGRPTGIADEMFSIRRYDEAVHVTDNLFETEDINKLEMTTEIPPDMIYGLATLRLVAKRFNSKVLTDFCKFLYQLEVSKDRQGRLELVEAILGSRRLGAEGPIED